MRWRMAAIIGEREWRAALGSRWFWIYGAMVLVLGAALLWFSGSMLPRGIPVEVADGRVQTATINLLALLVPLMGLTAGGQSLAQERDRRTLGYLLAQPISRAEVLLGKFLGNGVALGGVLLGGFALLAAGAWLLDLPPGPGPLLLLALLAWLPCLAALAIGMALSAGTAGGASVQGATLGTWLVLVLAGDLGLMGILMIRQLPIQAILFLTLLNPVHQFRVLAVMLIRTSVEVLGPVGIYAKAHLGPWLLPLLLAGLGAWVAGAGLIALDRFRSTRVLS